MVDRINIRHHLQILPAFYKILRIHGIDTYEGSVLFTIYNIDGIGRGARTGDIITNNCMGREMTVKNLKKLVDKGILTFTDVSVRIKEYRCTEAGIMLVRSVLERLENYKGEVINPTVKDGTTYMERRKDRAKRAVAKLSHDNFIVREVLAVAVEKGIIPADSVDTDKLGKIKGKFD